MQFPSFLGRSLMGRFLAMLLAVTLSVQPAMAQSMLRDAETEALLADMSAGIIQASGLQPKNVQIVLLQDKEINAFVAGGQIVYIHSGLITAAKNANEVQGVIAHEMGHVAGGHIIRSSEGIKTATGITLLSLLLGAAAVGFGNGAFHGAGHLVSIENDLAIHIARGTANRLDERGFGAQEAFLVGIQNGDKGAFRNVQTFTQQVDADEYIESAQA